MVIYLLPVPLSEDIRHDPTALPDWVLHTVQGIPHEGQLTCCLESSCRRPWCNPLPSPHHHREPRFIANLTPSKPNTSPKLNHSPICPTLQQTMGSKGRVFSMVTLQDGPHTPSAWKLCLWWCCFSCTSPLTAGFSHMREKGSLFPLITASTPWSSLPSKTPGPSTPFYQMVSSHFSCCSCLFSFWPHPLISWRFYPLDHHLSLQHQSHHDDWWFQNPG